MLSSVNSFGNATTSINSKLGGALGGVIDTVLNTAECIISALTCYECLMKIQDILTKIFCGSGSSLNIMDTILGALHSGLSILGNAKHVAMGVVNDILGTIQTGFGVKETTNVVTNAVSSALDIAGNAINSVAGLVGSAMSSIGSVAGNLLKCVSGELLDGVEGLLGYLGGLGKKLLSLVTPVFDMLKGVIDMFVNGFMSLVDFIARMIENIGSFIDNLFKQVQDLINDLFRIFDSNHFDLNGSYNGMLDAMSFEDLIKNLFDGNILKDIFDFDRKLELNKDRHGLDFPEFKLPGC